MKVEVWSDVMCPFCYIGKHHYEEALKKFSGAANVELEWKSFQLDPDLPKETQYADTFQYLAERKGMPYDQARQMTAGVSEAGKQAGLDLNFEKAVVANTFDAHRLIHFAQTEKLGNAVKEALFRAHFTDGKDISDPVILQALGEEVGLESTAVRQVLDSNRYAYEVTQDIQDARNIGVRGVPFFVFNRKYAVSGAQPADVFLETLEKSFTEWQATHPKISLEVNEGPSCSPDGTCE